MKKLYFLRMVLMAVLMSVNFASCSNEDGIQEEATKDKYITVGLDCVGEYLEVADSPLSRAAGDDIYFIQVYSLVEIPMVEGTYYEIEETPYAYGIFETSLDGVTIKLLEGKDYRFKVGIGVKSAGYIEGSGYSKEFNYSSTSSIYPAGQISVHYEGFYGELDKYTPVKDSNVSISTKRVSYAAKFIAEGLNEGELNIQVSNRYEGWNLYSVSLTPGNQEHDKIYSFHNVYQAWKGIETPTGNYDSDTGKPLYEYKNYTSEKKLDISWTKANGEVFPLGVYYVTFKRNIRTTIRIKVEDRSVSNGITVTREDTPITDDENEYVIEGGQVVEVPMSSSQS